MVTHLQASSLSARKIGIVILATLFLTACSDGMSVPRNQLTAIPHKTGDEKNTVNDAFSAALTPLEDLGIRKRDIPQMLQALVENPYYPPEKMKCDGIKTELTKLDVLLGPDIDTPKLALSGAEQYEETGANLMHDAVVGLVRSQTSFIPMRSIVRRITGAESHEKAVAKATEAGKLRRAYLRGLADARFGNKCLNKAVIVVNNDLPAEKTTDTRGKMAAVAVDYNDPNFDPNAQLEVAHK